MAEGGQYQSDPTTVYNKHRYSSEKEHDAKNRQNQRKKQSHTLRVRPVMDMRQL